MMAGWWATECVDGTPTPAGPLSWDTPLLGHSPPPTQAGPCPGTPTIVGPPSWAVPSTHPVLSGPSPVVQWE